MPGLWSRRDCLKTSLTSPPLNGVIPSPLRLQGRQILIRRELDMTAKDLTDKARKNEASSDEFFELGVVLLRKRYYAPAVKNLKSAIETWEGDEADLSQVHNALGFAYVGMNSLSAAIREYRTAVEFQPGYVVAWNNLADAYEKADQLEEALEAYQEALRYDPENEIANRQSGKIGTKVERMRGIPKLPRQK